MKKVRIIYIMEATAGGTRRYITQILLHLDLEIFEPILFCSVMRDPAFMGDIEKIRKRGIKVLKFPMKRAISPFSDLSAINSMTQAIKQEKPGIVHTHSSKAGIIGRIAARRAGVEFITHTPHVFPFEMALNPLKKSLYLYLERMAAKRTDLLIAVSHAEKEIAIEKRLFTDKTATVNTNGIEPELWDCSQQKPLEMREKLGIREQDFIVGMVGRFMPQKGHNVLLDAAESLIKQEENLRFVLIGDGRLKASIQHKVKIKKIEDSFYFFDETDNIASFYAFFDCLVLPSLWEGCPYTVLEAMAMGIPVIASSVGGVPELISDGHTGLLVPPGHPDKLAEAISKLCENCKLCDELKNNAKEEIENKFLLTQSIKRLEEIYQNLIKK